MSAIKCLGGVLHGELFEYAKGPTVPVDAMHLLAELDVRGIHVQQNGERLRVYRDDDAPIVYEEGERERIVRFKLHLLAIVAYVEGQKEPAKQPSRYEQPSPKPRGRARASGAVA